MVPTSQTGKVGDTVQILGSLGTANSTYKIWFGNNLVVTNTSQGYYVDSSFAVPELSGGNYTITLNDVSKNVNDTTTFLLLTAYSIKPIVPSAPGLLQEGSNVDLNVALTGAQSSTTYYANITVSLPEPLSMNYSRLIELRTTQTGTARVTITYPDAAFQPSGSFTNVAGLYHVYFNMTQMLADNYFLIGFTDASEYHRGQSVAIRAIGYQPNQDATITITYTTTGANVHSEAVTASSEGIINAAWIVPSNALIGEYNITITPQGTPKLIVDSQLFTVPGYPVKIQTLNLAGDIVSQLAVEAVDQATNTLYNGTSGVDGIATINLENGNHTITAFWNDVKVGEISVSITKESTFDLQCRLTNLKIVVQDKNGVLLPFVNIDLAYQYVTTKGGVSKTGRASGQTGLSGTFTFNSTLPEISYTINASIYGVVFNTNNNTISNLPAQPAVQVTILCPNRTLTLKIIDYNLAVIPNARVELVEQTSGIFVAGVTDNSGVVSMEVTFGKYRLRIYAGNTLLNETIIEVFNDTQSEVRCVLYNLQVSVVVVDYFGQAIPNANIVLRDSEQAMRSAVTQTDGKATFANVIGGNMQIIAYLSGRDDSFEAVNLQVEAPTAIEIKMSKYVLVGPFLIETSLLATLIITFVAVILLLFIEILRKKRLRQSKSKS
jgi:hypothetical protein